MSSPEIEQAAACLLSGQLVAMPTETVYGLAAPINNHESLKQIFVLKQRPFFDPLIIHVASLDQARTLTRDWNQAADVLAKKFWPGPLTLVLSKSEQVDSLITSGLETVGIRCPDHPLAMELISHVNTPLAAPSANLFSKTSPTSPRHVRRDFPNLFVLDGGDCQVGIESTVVSVERVQGGEEFQICELRPGVISIQQIEQALSSSGIKLRIIPRSRNINAPGQIEHHYMPRVPLHIVKSPEQLTQFSQSAAELKLSADPRLAARELYSEMHKLSDLPNINKIYFVLQDYHYQEGWLAIIDRIQKASQKGG